VAITARSLRFSAPYGKPLGHTAFHPRRYKLLMKAIGALEPSGAMNKNGTNQHTGGNGGFDNVKASAKGGNSADYLAARLARDFHPRCQNRSSPAP
jgi:hypothetical protein